MKSLTIAFVCFWALLHEKHFSDDFSEISVCGSCPAQKRGGASGVLQVVFFKLSILRKSIFFCLFKCLSLHSSSIEFDTAQLTYTFSHVTNSGSHNKDHICFSSNE